MPGGGAAHLGSSPLARGTRPFTPDTQVCTGLIPARAGNTFSSLSSRESLRAHPRSRGEHVWGKVSGPFPLGSSPLARGTRFSDAPEALGAGLIPARAGNTGFVPLLNFLAGAHPRSRGEHHHCAQGPVASLGSSPLARGTPAVSIYSVSMAGLIPARAGNTWLFGCSTSCSRAHPRSRGEHLVSLIVTCWHVGSSPLARGTPGFPDSDVLARGLIPARAGNTWNRT